MGVNTALVDTPRKQMLKKKLKRLQKENSRLKCALKKRAKVTSVEATCLALSKFFSGATLHFMEQQVKLANCRPPGRRWTPLMKSIALSIFHASPKAFGLLKKLFALPCIETLKCSLRRLNIYPGFSKAVLSAIKMKSQCMSSQDKNCALIFDEMSIKRALSYDSRRDEIEGLEDLGNGLGKSIASSALVFLVRGLKTKWKQPLSFHISTSTIKHDVLRDLICQAIREVRETGLNPVVLICDQGPNNRACLSRLDVSPETPYFEVDGKAVHVMYDTPHLVKNIRNNFKAQILMFDGKPVKWEYVSMFYELDSKRQIRLAPKLRSKHINIPPFKNMNVRLAAQVLSHSVASGIKMLIKKGKMPQEAEPTADFIEFFDKLFNVFNSTSKMSSSQFKHALYTGSSHWQFMDTAVTKLSSLKTLTGSILPCVKGWLQNIAVIKVLFDNLGMTYLCTARFNQDCLENLFSQIRRKGCQRDNPDAQQFRAAFRDILVDYLIDESKVSNCDVDLDEMLFDLEDLSRECTLFDEPLEPIAEFCVTDHMYARGAGNQVDQETLDVIKNIQAYISGYIVKILKKSVCNNCYFFLTDPTEVRPESVEFISIKDYCQNEVLVRPTGRLLDLINDIDKIYTSSVDECTYQGKVKRRLVEMLMERSASPAWCSGDCCHLKKQVCIKFVNIRLHHALSLINSELVQEKKKQNRKYLKLSNL